MLRSELETVNVFVCTHCGSVVFCHLGEHPAPTRCAVNRSGCNRVRFSSVRVRVRVRVRVPHRRVMQEPLVPVATASVAADTINSTTAQTKSASASAARLWRVACTCCTLLATVATAGCFVLWWRAGCDVHPSLVQCKPPPPPSPPPFMKPIVPTVTLNNGVAMPMISFGTWPLTGAAAAANIQLAWDVGFTHFDTALNYGNQDEVGRVLRGRARDSYFVTTKVSPFHDRPLPPTDVVYEQTMQAVRTDLDELNMSHVDLMLLHFPQAMRDNGCEVMQEQWRALDDAQRQGRARAIGVSNYCPSSLYCLQKNWTTVPAVNQIQFHVGMYSDPHVASLRALCASMGITVQAYSPFGLPHAPELVDGPLLTSLGRAGEAAAHCSNAGGARRGR